MTNECPSCSNEYVGLGTHWRRSDCVYPKLTGHQHEVATGLLMGDGHLNTSTKNPRLQVVMTNEKYLQYLDNIFGVLSTGVKFDKTAEQLAEYNRSSGCNISASSDNYSDSYRWESRSLPDLRRYTSWYIPQKVWPDDICLTSTILKHWYAGDGHYRSDGDYISIGITNEMDNRNKVDLMFSNVGLPKPHWGNNDITFTKQESGELFEYMGEPLPGFEYKWRKV